LGAGAIIFTRFQADEFGGEPILGPGADVFVDPVPVVGVVKDHDRLVCA